MFVIVKVPEVGVLYLTCVGESVKVPVGVMTELKQVPVGTSQPLVHVVTMFSHHWFAYALEVVAVQVYIPEPEQVSMVVAAKLVQPMTSLPHAYPERPPMPLMLGLYAEVPQVLVLVQSSEMKPSQPFGEVVARVEYVRVAEPGVVSVVLRRMDIVLGLRFVATRSVFPSPLKSPLAILEGLLALR